MAVKSVSELNEVTTLNDDDLFMVSTKDGSGNYSSSNKLTYGNLRNGISAGGLGGSGVFHLVPIQVSLSSQYFGNVGDVYSDWLSCIALKNMMVITGTHAYDVDASTSFTINNKTIPSDTTDLEPTTAYLIYDFIHLDTYSDLHYGGHGETYFRSVIAKGDLIRCARGYITGYSSSSTFPRIYEIKPITSLDSTRSSKCGFRIGAEVDYSDRLVIVGAPKYGQDTGDYKRYRVTVDRDVICTLIWDRSITPVHKCPISVNGIDRGNLESFELYWSGWLYDYMDINQKLVGRFFMTAGEYVEFDDYVEYKTFLSTSCKFYEVY